MRFLNEHRGVMTLTAFTTRMPETRMETNRRTDAQDRARHAPGRKSMAAE
jgi:hypothetical protein